MIQLQTRESHLQKEAVFVKTTLDQDENKYVSNLYHLDLKTNDATQWTYGKQSVSHPRWSNDGQNILFLSNRDDKNQVYILSTKGGEAKKVTDEKEGVTSAEFSPDSKRIIYQTGYSLEGDDSSDDKDKDEQELPKPKVIHRMKYKADGAGLLKEKYQQLKLLDLSSEDVKTVKKGKQNFIFQSWINNSTFVYSTDEDVNQDFNFNHNVYIHHLDRNEDQEIPTEDGYVSSFTVSPNGQQLLFIHMGRKYYNATHTEIYHYELDSGVVTPLTTELDAPIGDFVVADTQQQLIYMVLNGHRIVISTFLYQIKVM
ncbi:TolB family protein [Piscibacillus salipiscarius]|uniref:TolB family protein n=1 Tax=Piscibacillus salipiscarius TaxID=299480 RepID=UPI0034E2D65C